MKELGVKQSSLFWWIGKKNVDIAAFGIMYLHEFHDLEEDTLDQYDYYSAFTVAELGEMLPNTVQTINGEPFDNYRILIQKFYTVDEKLNKTNNFIINYECDSTEATGQNAWLRRKLTNNIFDSNEANARAKMLVYLIENGLYKP